MHMVLVEKSSADDGIYPINLKIMNYFFIWLCLGLQTIHKCFSSYSHQNKIPVNPNSC